MTEVEFEPKGACFNLTMSAWMNLFADIGFDVTKDQELDAPERASETRAAITADWGKSYPVEQIWQLKKPE